MAEHHREELLERATDYVLSYGLIGLSLRPLAADIGTSDRMLIYHFANRDALVSAVVARTNQRAMAAGAAPPGAADGRSGVTLLWAAYGTEPLNSCMAVYCQAAPPGLFGREPYLTDARASGELWAGALRG